MKELLSKILERLPLFFTETGSLFVSPKSFAADKSQSADPFLDSLVYAAVAIALMAVLPLPWYHKADIWASVVTLGMQTLILLLLSAPFGRLIWYALGGRSSTKLYFAVFIYQSMLLSMIGAVTALVAFGYLYSSDPAFAAIVSDSVKKFETLPAGVTSRTDWRIYNAIEIVGFVLSLAWTVIAWGAFRQVFGLSKTRSLVAFAISFLVVVPALGVAYYALIAFSRMSA